MNSPFETRLNALLMAKFTYLVAYSFRKVYFQSQTLVFGICLARNYCLFSRSQERCVWPASRLKMSYIRRSR